MTFVGLTALSVESCTRRSTPVRAGGFKQVARAEDIVFDGLGRTELHQRHMFVRRRMENDLRMIQLKYFVQAVLVADRADQRDHRQSLP